MPTVYIDDEPFEFEPGTKVLQFCLDMGLVLPHFCYHPAMSVPANCRQCLVKAGMPARNRETGQIETDDNGDPIINFFPKLQTSCSLDLVDGMVVLTQRTSEEVAGAHPRVVGDENVAVGQLIGWERLKQGLYRLWERQVEDRHRTRGVGDGVRAGEMLFRPCHHHREPGRRPGPHQGP